MLRCHCIKCSFKVFNYADQFGWDLYQEGFIPNYYWWKNHGEELQQFPAMDVKSLYYEIEELSPFHQIIMDDARPLNAHNKQKNGVIGSEYMKEKPLS